MTIDEFKENIAPHMNKGFVAMNHYTKSWRFFQYLSDDYTFIKGFGKEWIYKNKTHGWQYFGVDITNMFKIEPVEDWTKSLIEVGR